VVFDLGKTWEYLGIGSIQTGLFAAIVLGLVAGVMGPLIVMRRMPFAVHGTSELAFTGGAAALLLGVGIEYGALAGAVLAALLLGILGARDDDRDSVIGVILAFGLGMGVLLLSFYKGRSGNKFGILTGQILTIDSTNLTMFLTASVVVLIVLALIYRPLLFASVDRNVAVARGVPVKALTVVFALLVGVATALSVKVVGSLLVVALMVTPAAAAARVTASPWKATVLSIVFAEVSAVGGIILSLAPGLPVSPFVTSISFLIYVVCRILAWARDRRTEGVPQLTPASTEPAALQPGTR